MISVHLHTCRWLALALALATSWAQASETETGQDEAPEAWNAHGQTTYTVQRHGAFTSPYTGPNSLSPIRSSKETFDATLFLGARLWRGAAVYLNPEVDQGFGLSDTVGVAGFPSGEAYKVGHSSAYGRMDRLFLRQTIDLGGATEKVEPDANVLGDRRSADNLVLTVGRFAVVDLFDTNSVAHDAKSDFLNWAIVDGGAFDYAADAWGYSNGAAVEWTREAWTLRGGVFALSTVPNGEKIDKGFGQYELLGEAEWRPTLMGRPAKLKLLAFMNRGRMGRYADALSAAGSGAVPDVAAVRRTASRGGAVLNAEWVATTDLGLYVRASANDGSKETYEFTDINRSVSAGLRWKGCAWKRCGDALGLAGAVNQISSQARAYFAAGGLGLLVGDGRLPHPGPEQIVEAFYALQLGAGLALTADVQRIVHIAYNRDRGPVNIVGLRAHAEF